MRCLSAAVPNPSSSRGLWKLHYSLATSALDTVLGSGLSIGSLHSTYAKQSQAKGKKQWTRTPSLFARPFAQNYCPSMQECPRQLLLRPGNHAIRINGSPSLPASRFPLETHTRPSSALPPSITSFKQSRKRAPNPPCHRCCISPVLSLLSPRTR